MFPKTIRFRLTMTLGVVLLGAAGALLSLFPHRVHREQVEALHERIQGAAEVAAHDLAPMLAPGGIDTVSIRRTLASVRKVRDVIEVEVVPADSRSSGHFAASADPLLLEGVTPPPPWVTGASADRSSYQIYFPIRVDVDTPTGARRQAQAFLRILASMDATRAYVEAQLRTLVWIMAIVAALLLGVTWLIAQIATRPLRRIAETAEEIATGELGLRADEGGGGEIGALARSFNHMVSRLESAQSDALSANRHLEQILANVPAGIALVDHDLEILSVNSAVISDPVRRALAPGRSPRQLLGRANPRAADTIEEMLRGCLESGTDTEAEVELTLDGKDRAVFLRATRLDGVAERPRLLICALDVSGLRRAEEQLRDTEEELRQAQKMEAVGRLAGGVAHDFNNLLTVIGGQAQFAELELDRDHPASASVEEIRQASDRATQLTRQLLAFSRRQVLAPKRLDVNEVVHGIAGLLDRLLGEDVRLELELEEELPAIEADPGQLEQVLMNLAVNARDAMPQGGHIRIRTAAGDPLGGRVSARISVEDDGIGMDEKTRGLIFEPFFTTKEVGSGTGLGLSTVYGIVEQSGGAIHVESEVGVGSTFHVELPGLDSSQGEAPSGPRLVPHDVSEESSNPRLHVLLVEDEPMVRALVRRQLNRLGHRVTAVENPRSALERLKSMELEPDLLLTDVVMPGMSGVEFASVVREILPDLPVLFMTGYAEQQLIRVGLDQEKVRLLRKPFTWDQLSAAISEVLADAASEWVAPGRRPAARPADRPVAQAHRKL